ncbi:MULTISPECIES: hypothetical protein [unclassified Microcoleus]|uniref:hypothetical protein n=1 Tax=unclassified Microcoleus TaxID=2642155 RepID=UPI002FD2DD1B
MPKRCPIARENQYFSKEIRQLLYGKGRNSYRIIFTIAESEDVSAVRILHIRHAPATNSWREPGVVPRVRQLELEQLSIEQYYLMHPTNEISCCV